MQATLTLSTEMHMKDIDIITHRIVGEGWHVGPHDFTVGLLLIPKESSLEKLMENWPAIFMLPDSPNIVLLLVAMLSLTSLDERELL